MVWTVVLSVLAAAAVIVIVASRGGGKNPDLGSVSDHWIAEHRRER